MNYYKPTPIRVKVWKLIQLFWRFLFYRSQPPVVKLKSRQLSVLMVVPTADRVGGYENQAKQLSAELARSDYLITVLTDRIDHSAEREFSDGFVIHRLASSRSSLRNALAQYSYFRQHRNTFDVVHVHGITGFSLFAIRLARFFDLPVIVKAATAKDFSLLFKSAGLKHRRYQKWLQQANTYIAISEQLEKEMSSCGIPVSKIKRIPNFVDTHKFQPASLERRNELRKILSASDAKACLFVGRLVQRKGVDILLTAWKDVRGAMLWIVGDGPERESLEKLAAQLKLQNVTFFGMTQNVVDFYQAADLFVFPSREEGSPGALLEAMSCGLPCIAARIGGIVDVANDRSHGLLLEPESAEMLAAAIQSALQNEAERKQWSENCRKQAEAYKLEKIAAIYKQLYDKERS